VAPVTCAGDAGGNAASDAAAAAASSALAATADIARRLKKRKKDAKRGPAQVPPFLYMDALCMLQYCCIDE
jgi:hypothetical protein